MENRAYIAPPNNTNPMLTLNIGGTKYTTTVQTLISNPNTLFSSLLRTLPRDKDNNIFIDRDPIYFRFILDSLRQGEIQHPYPSDSYDCIRFWKEIDFYRLLAPGHTWGFSRKNKLKHPALHISEDTFTATKILKSKPAIASVCGNHALDQGKYRWRVITDGIVGGITFGIVHITSFKLRKLKSSDVYGISTQGNVHNLERYGAKEEDEEVEETVDIGDPVSLMRNEVDLGKRVILNESGGEEEENGKENETSSVEAKEDSELDSDEDVSPKKVRFNDESSRDSEGRRTERLKRENRYLMEYDAGIGVVKIYKQDDEIWYIGKTDKKEGYYFFITLKDVGDKVRVELLE